jgi:hypothetical protein
MKVLTIKQPFAELILQGKKTIELRKWNTKFRGDFLVHASKNADLDAMKKFNFSERPAGFILGKTSLIDVKHYGNEEQFNEDKGKHLTNSAWGNYGFLLKDSSKFEKPIPALGKLGFWNFEGNIK